MFHVTVTYVSTRALRAFSTVLMRPLADGPVNWAMDVEDRNRNPMTTNTALFISHLFRLPIRELVRNTESNGFCEC